MSRSTSCISIRMNVSRWAIRWKRKFSGMLMKYGWVNKALFPSHIQNSNGWSISESLFLWWLASYRESDFFLRDDAVAAGQMPRWSFNNARQDRPVLQRLCFPWLKAKLQAVGTNELFLEAEYELCMLWWCNAFSIVQIFILTHSAYFLDSCWINNLDV